MKSLPCFVFLLLVLAPNHVYVTAQTASATAGGGNCNVPLIVKDRSKSNMFSEQQEEWLGEIEDADIRKDFNVIADPEGRLQKIGERLLAQLPPTSIHYHFVIVDSPDLNSFSLAGGRVYIHRRIIAFTQNEDELAGVLGHEIGHIVAHDVAIRMSDWFSQLGITSVGDRQDLFAKWNRFKDNSSKVKGLSSKSEEAEQVVADRISLYAMARAGYDPSRYVEFADRLLQTHGKAGGFWSDFFGTTPPDAKRLREIIKNTAPLASTCIGPRVADADHFDKWKTTIIESQRMAAKEELPGLVKKTALEPRLRDDLEQIQFSPNGKYLLAQDGSSIFVLTSEPLANVFRIDALDAQAAQFSPDSASVVFYDKELRVEKWDIASKQRTAIHQLSIPDCFQSKLSNSGETLACVDAEFTLWLVDVATNKPFYTRKDFYELDYWTYLDILDDLRAGHPMLFDMKFSPDDHYFAIGTQKSSFAYDIAAKAEAHLPRSIRNVMEHTFAFNSSSEIVGIEYTGRIESGGKANMVRLRFPSGEKVDEFNLNANGWISSSGNSNYVLMRPAGTYPVGIVDLTQRKVDQAFKSSAFAIYGKTFAGEQSSGEIGLFHPGESTIASRVALPESPLATLRASAFSPDGKWLAVSGSTRGSLWKMENGERVFFTKGFEGAEFDNGHLIAKFARNEPTPSRVFTLDPVSKETKKLYESLDEAQRKNRHAYQVGPLLVVIRPEKDKENETRLVYFRGGTTVSGTAIMEVHDVRDNKLVWQRKLHGGDPGMFYSGSTLTVTTSSWADIKAAVEDNPALKEKLNAMEGKKQALLAQVFEPLTGKQLGAVIVDTGKHSFDVGSTYTMGDFVFVGDPGNNRTLVYSLKTGEQKVVLVGHIVAVTSKGDRVLMGNDHGTTELYNTGDLQPLAHYSFPARIMSADFAADGSLLVLTSDQNVYQISMPAGTQAAK